MMDYRQWTQLQNTEKLRILKNAAANNALEPTDDMIHWWYWMTCHLDSNLKTVSANILAQLKKQTEARVLDQLREIYSCVENILDQCLTFRMNHFETIRSKPCPLTQSSCWDQCGPPLCESYYGHYHECFQWRKHSSSLCSSMDRQAVMESKEIIRCFLIPMVSSMYYVWKLFREDKLRFPIDMEEIHMPPVNDLRSWEVICEDDEEQILFHPALPHPSDFIIQKKKKDGQSWADMARFVISVPTLLSQGSVILSKTPTVFPRVIKPILR